MTISKQSAHPRIRVGEATLDGAGTTTVLCPGLTANSFVKATTTALNGTITLTVDYLIVPGAGSFTIAPIESDGVTMQDANHSTFRWSASLDPTQA